MFTFKKIERLSSKKDITLLYNSGKSKTFFPLKIYWRENSFESNYPARILVTVPKRLYKKAVDRNVLKRRIKEAYRLQKQAFYDQLHTANCRVDIMILYTSKEKSLLPEIMTSMNKALAHAASEIIASKNLPNNVK